MVDWPRILFLGSEPPGPGGAGSTYFERLLQDVPRDRLFVATHQPAHAIGAEFGDKLHHVRLPLARLDRTRLWRLRFLGRLVGLPALVSFAEMERALPFAPDLVVTLMQDSLMYASAAHFAHRRGIPICAFVHDLSHGFEPLPPPIEALRLAADGRFLRRCAAIVSVSDGMRDYLRDRWGVDSHVIRPPAPDRPIRRAPESCGELKTPGRLTLGYAGGFHYGYGLQLERLFSALAQSGTHVHVFGASPPASLRERPNVDAVFTFHGRRPTPEAAWRDIADTCDGVLLPYADPPGRFELQYQTHFPSKLAEMVNLGMPIVVTGPASASGVAWLRSHPGCALHIDRVDEAGVISALSQLRDDPAMRVRLAIEALKRAPEFEARPAREAFQTLCQDIGAHKGESPVPSPAGMAFP